MVCNERSPHFAALDSASSFGVALLPVIVTPGLCSRWSILHSELPEEVADVHCDTNDRFKLKATVGWMGETLNSVRCCHLPYNTEIMVLPPIRSIDNL